MSQQLTRRFAPTTESDIAYWQEVLQHSPYGSDLATSGYHLFSLMKKFLVDKHFTSDDEVKSTVCTGLYLQKMMIYGMGICNFMPRWEKSVARLGDSVEKIV
ncbi:hypothetical protein Trydic_g3089 [Trypoxylus dichotomus]